MESKLYPSDSTKNTLEMECSVVIAILPIRFYLALIPISKGNYVMGILILNVGDEHLLLPYHVVCASVINDPN